MSNKSENKIAARAIAASLVVAGTLAGASQGMAMENNKEDSLERFPKIIRNSKQVFGESSRENSFDPYRTYSEKSDVRKNASRVLSEMLEEMTKNNGGDREKIENLKFQLDTLNQIQLNLHQQWMEQIQLQSAAQGLEHQKKMEKLGVQSALQTSQYKIVTPSLYFMNVDKKCIASLDLTNDTKISGSDLSKYPNLVSLDLTNNTMIDGYALRNCKNLTSLNLTNNTTIDGYALRNCENLTSLNLTNNTTIDGYALRNCKNLTSLDLNNNTMIDTYTLRNCPKLVYLNLTNNNKISNSDIRSLRQNNPNLVIIGRL